MNIQLLHDITFYVLYASAALATFVAVERMIYYSVTLKHARRFVAGNGDSEGATLAAAIVKEASTLCQQTDSRHDIEDITESIYLGARENLQRHLWMLDTVVTAAPLLGLLGTILGIIDTFTALARSGISDPQSVSAGIGTALFATALGIAVALYGLLFHNFFQDRVDRISETIKILLLGAARGASVRP